MSNVIFFDLDGVLADFVRGALKLHKADLAMKDVRWDFNEQIGLGGDNAHLFWEPMGYAFWANLPVLHDGLSLLMRVESIFGAKNIGFLTSPCATPGCIEGKKDWVKKYFPTYQKRVLFGSAKHLIASTNKVLVDDSDVNIKEFKDHDGLAIQVPRPWNRLKYLTDSEGNFEPNQVYDIIRKVTLAWPARDKSRVA